MLWIDRSTPKTGKPKPKAELESKPPPPHTVKFSVGLTDMDIADFDEDKEAEFKKGVAAKLGVDPSEVIVTASAGSVNIEIAVSVASEEAASDLAEIAEAAKEDIVDTEVFGAFEVSEVEVMEPVEEEEEEEPGTNSMGKGIKEDVEIESMRSQLEQKSKELGEMSSMLTEAVAKHQAELDDKEAVVAELQEQLEELQAAAGGEEDLAKALEEAKQEIDTLKQKLEQFAAPTEREAELKALVDDANAQAEKYKAEADAAVAGASGVVDHDEIEKLQKALDKANEKERSTASALAEARKEISTVKSKLYREDELRAMTRAPDTPVRAAGVPPPGVKEMRKHFTPSLEDEMKQMFNALDSDNSGTIDREEVCVWVCVGVCVFVRARGCARARVWVAYLRTHTHTHKHTHPQKFPYGIIHTTHSSSSSWPGWRERATRSSRT